MLFHSTVIFVNNIEKSKDFYTKHLGFTIVHDFGKNIIFNSGLAIWEIRSEHIIHKQLKIANNSNKFELYFENNNIEAIFNDIEKAGVKFLHKIHEEPWGQRTFRFFDPDEHLIEIGEPLEIFVKNLMNKGLTKIQISEKTGITIDTINKLLEHDN